MGETLPLSDEHFCHDATRLAVFFPVDFPDWVVQSCEEVVNFGKNVPYRTVGQKAEGEQVNETK